MKNKMIEALVDEAIKFNLGGSNKLVRRGLRKAFKKVFADNDDAIEFLKGQDLTEIHFIRTILKFSGDTHRKRNELGITREEFMKELPCSEDFLKGAYSYTLKDLARVESYFSEKWLALKEKEKMRIEIKMKEDKDE